jgi:hypothetical protein
MPQERAFHAEDEQLIAGSEFEQIMRLPRADSNFSPLFNSLKATGFKASYFHMAGSG